MDLRDALVRMLLQLPPRQRAVLVLRYWEQLTEAETAAALGWPEGTVKSATSRGCGGSGSSPQLARDRPSHTRTHPDRSKGTRQMNIEVEELLRDSMERFTAEVRAPQALASRAASRLRRRRTARRALVAGGP